MTCSNLPVTSREYKLLLNTDRFADRKAGAEHFRELVEFLAPIRAPSASRTVARW